ncbi:unnamed protein product, partial [Polarella glacialis]
VGWFCAGPMAMAGFVPLGFGSRSPLVGVAPATSLLPQQALPLGATGATGCSAPGGLGVALAAAAAVAAGYARRQRASNNNNSINNNSSNNSSSSSSCRAGSRLVRAASPLGGDLDAWRKGFCEVEEPKDGFYFLEVEGLPPDLKGTYFRNSPGKFKSGDSLVRHQLDGDGLMLGISFDEGGRVLVRHRLVQTQGLLRDNYHKRIFAQGHFGTPVEGGNPFDPRQKDSRTPKNTANTGVAYWAGKLLALGPFDKPFEMEPGCLGTVIGNQPSGATDLGEALDKDVGYGSTPKVCGTEGCLTNFSQTASALETTIRFFEFAKDEWRPRYKVPRMLRVSGCTRFADFGITKKWLVLARPPLKVDGFGAAMGKSFRETLQNDEAGVGEFVFATRLKKESQEVSVPVDNLVCEEIANAYELEGDRVVVDLVAADRWSAETAPDGDKSAWQVDDFSSTPRRRLVRYEVDLKAKTWTKRELCDRHLGFTSVNPAFNGKKHRFVFAAVPHGAQGEVGPMAGIAKIDVESGEVDAWTPGPSEFGGQPLFVPKPGAEEEDAGYLLTVVFDGAAQSSEVVVLDAQAVSKGPVCRFPLQVALPHGLRSCWAEGVSFEPQDMKRKMTLLRMFQKKAQSWNAMDSSFSTLGSKAFFDQQGVRLR